MSTSTETTSLVSDPSSISTLNRGPITSVFSAPSSCLATLTLNEKGDALYFGHLGNSYVDTGCYPTGNIDAQKLVTDKSWDTYYYSPAICPTGWTIATTFESSFPGGKGVPTFLYLGSDTTAALCCPSKFSYNGQGHQCASSITQGQVAGFVNPVFNGQSWARGTVTTNTFTTATSVNGDGVPIWWKDSDSSLLAAASTILPSPTASGPTPTGSDSGSSPSSINSSTPTPSSQSGGLSTGAKIGIGIAVPLAVILGLAIGFFLFRTRRQRTSPHGVTVHEAYSGADAEPKPIAQPLYEIQTQAKAYHSPHELPGPGQG